MQGRLYFYYYWNQQERRRGRRRGEGVQQSLPHHRLNIELELQSLFGPHVLDFTHWLRPRNPPPPHIWAPIRGRYWSAKIDDISL
jgi:hypothetical protein